jgi:hypothetical protein
MAISHPKSRITMNHEYQRQMVNQEDHVTSPAALPTDIYLSATDADETPTPPEVSAIDLLRTGPFSQLLPELRLTQGERDMMEDLLTPGPTLPDLLSEQSTRMKRKVTHRETVEERLHHVRRVQSQPECTRKRYRDLQVCSSGLNPADIAIPEDFNGGANEEPTLLSAASMDAFFNLDAASAAASDDHLMEYYVLGLGVL